MKFFMEMEEAVEAFDKLAKVESRIVYIVVPFPRDRDNLIHDLAILLSRFNLVIRSTGIRIKGTKQNPSKSIIIVSKEESKRQLAGIREEDIIELI